MSEKILAHTLHGNEAEQRRTEAEAPASAPVTEDSQHRAIIVKIAQVAAAIGWQAGVSATELAGQVVSFLAVNPEHIARFLAEGSELFIDGTIRTESGCLTYTAQSGALLSPADLRRAKGMTDQ